MRRSREREKERLRSGGMSGMGVKCERGREEQLSWIKGKGPLRLMFTCVFFLDEAVSSLQRCGSRGDICMCVCVFH